MESWSANSYRIEVVFLALVTWGGKKDTDLGNGVLNDLLACQIRLVADEKLVYALGRVSVNLLEPLLHVCEGVYATSQFLNKSAI